MTTDQELRARATVNADGSGQIAIGDRLEVIEESDENAARRAVMLRVSGYARDKNSLIVLEALDSRGVAAHVAIYPDGDVAPITQPAPVVEPGDGAAPRSLPTPVAPLVASLDDELERTRLVATTAPSGYVLRFSTGEVVTPARGGFIGRKPKSEHPGDDLVRVDDPTRSVSRTHLSFGNESGQMWIADQHSANGTAIYRGGDEIVCVPGQRYPLYPGYRVKIGEQWFTIFEPVEPSQ